MALQKDKRYELCSCIVISYVDRVAKLSASTMQKMRFATTPEALCKGNSTKMNLWVKMQEVDLVMNSVDR